MICCSTHSWYWCFRTHVFTPHHHTWSSPDNTLSFRLLPKLVAVWTFFLGLEMNVLKSCPPVIMFLHLFFSDTLVLLEYTVFLCTECRNPTGAQFKTLHTGCVFLSSRDLFLFMSGLWVQDGIWWESATQEILASLRQNCLRFQLVLVFTHLVAQQTFVMAWIVN